MIWTKPPGVATQIFKDAVWRIPGTNKIYLTFDDGPTPGITNRVLALLDDFDIKATFFCLGKNVEKYPALYQKIIEKGHKTGNHGYSHLKGWSVNNTDYFNDIEKAQKLIKSNLFRPPYGRIKPSQLSYLKTKYKIIMWTILSGDYNIKLSPEKVYNNVINNISEGSIIVFHDSEKAFPLMMKTLPVIIEKLKSKGFSFGCL